MSFEPVTKESEDAKVAVNRTVLDPEEDAAVTAALLATADSPSSDVAAAPGTEPVPSAT